MCLDEGWSIGSIRFDSIRVDQVTIATRSERFERKDCFGGREEMGIGEGSGKTAD